MSGGDREQFERLSELRVRVLYDLHLMMLEALANARSALHSLPDDQIHDRGHMAGVQESTEYWAQKVQEILGDEDPDGGIRARIRQARGDPT